MRMNQHQPIGILGGMGPDASARLYQLMIEMARNEYGVSRNEEYPEVILDSVPVPDFIADTQRAEEAMFMLRKRVRLLSLCGVGTLALACNTAHLTLTDLRQETEVPFISISSEVAETMLERGYQKVGLLASPVTIYSGIYQHPLLKRKIEIVLPSEKEIELLGKSIKEVIAGVFKPAKKRLLKIADHLKKQKAEALILGCTELPLVFPKNYSLPTIDSLEILAKALLKRYYQKEAT